MSTHAPGPWAWDGTYPIRIIDAQGYVVCGDIMPSGAGNARLIVAAPTMLAALEDVCEWLESIPGDLGDFAKANLMNAQAAIRKAEGKS